MSTKSSIAYGNSFHLYKECFDEENVYLELESVEFNASNNQVTVTIPVAIWEVIRAYGAVDLSYANYSDAEIETIVEEEVDRRMEKYRSTKDERARKFASLSGSICYGSAELPKNEQIENGVRYYRQVRERQLSIKNQIEEIKKLNNIQAAPETRSEASPHMRASPLFFGDDGANAPFRATLNQSSS